MVNRKILVPDVHGRNFWKVVKNFVNDYEITFLGDYLDPYPHEGISKLEAIDNFKEIIQFARENKNSVKLLLGNHDLTYYRHGELNVWANRIDHENMDTIHKLFDENEDLFYLSDFFIGGATKCLFTHAGINKYWFDLYKDTLFKGCDYEGGDVIGISETINSWLEEENKNSIQLALMHVGFERGGSSRCGSMVWCDCREMEYDENKSFIQFFGHSQQRVTGKPYFSNDFAICLDCREVFSVDEFGDLCDIYGNLYEER